MLLLRINAIQGAALVFSKVDADKILAVAKPEEVECVRQMLFTFESQFILDNDQR